MKNNDELIRRIERLEEAVACLAGNWGYAPSQLRRDTQRKLEAVVSEARERVERRWENATERIRFDGSNVDEVIAFVGDSGGVRKDERTGDLWAVGHSIDGTSIPLRRGLWLARDPRSGLIYQTRPVTTEAIA